MSYFGQELQRRTGETYIRDYTHAAKVFRTAGYELSPKLKFLFHTYFDINPDVYAINPQENNFGVLVKSVKLPSFSIKTFDLNQYNRKRIIQTKINYENINITFHDDSNNVITKLWDAYYSYYFKDSTNLDVFKGKRGSTGPSADGSTAMKQNYNNRNIYNKDLTGDNNWGYIGETFADSTSQVKVPFFRNITVFGFSRHNFTAYTLINPMITKFDHDSYNYNEGAGTLECKMDISYETVVYNEGGMDGRNPDNIVQGFALNTYYDKELSPITPDGNNEPVPGPSGYEPSNGGFVQTLKG